MSQYSLSLSLPPSYSADNFCVSDCNREAWQWISSWPRWPSHAVLLYGPKGSGKTHLGQVWAAKAHASILPAHAIASLEPTSMGSHWLIEDIDQFCEEESLLHLFNYNKEKNGNLLLTSSVPAVQLPFTLPDLTSRLLAVPAAAIGQPDDAVLAWAMRKQFADRQMDVADDVITYILTHSERTLAGITALTEHLDRQALAERKSITIPFVKRILEKTL